MAIFTLTIPNFSPALDRQHQEVERLHRYLNLAVQDFRGSGGKHTSGNIIEAGGVNIVGSWVYTPQASS